MVLERILLGGGVALTTCGLVAVVVIQTVRVAPIAGVLGVVSGVIFGIGAFAAVVLTYGDASPRGRRDVVAVAAFGYTALLVAGVGYASPGGLGAVIDPTVVVALGSLVAVLAWVSLWARDDA
jgi:hypothetical protein